MFPRNYPNKPLTATAVPIGVAQAYDVIANPRPEYSEDLRWLAWQTLKTARAERVVQHRRPARSLTPGPKGAA